ncbi:hypothetical protein LTR56_008985 [Elasticomyces elasticus]|nr:hypothetical protein LTR56_008985 [Elasticomyces elasticus]KAK4924112.1 hypothetical protein LTR49_008852 [Elasticomyces elasticus]KAK5764471.1 hypothetical protein LTS12_005447 [Elasticomyces elasticus]
MKTTPLTKMPMEMISLIAGHLSMAELRNLRLVSHWVEVQTFNDFAARGFKVYEFQGQHDDIDPLQSMIELCPRLTSCIEKLSVNDILELGIRRPRGSESALRMSSIVGTLPRLKHLAIAGYRYASFASHWDIGDLPEAQKRAFSGLRSIDVSGCQASSNQLIALLQIANMSLVDLEFDDNVVEPGGWLHVLREIQHSSGSLQMLSLERLTEYHSGEGVNIITTKLPLKTPGKDYYRAIRTSSGLGMVMVRQLIANMNGVQTVKEGLEMVIQHLAGGD